MIRILKKTKGRRARSGKQQGSIGRRVSGGVTLVEVLIMMLISLLISVIVVGLMYESALAIKDMYAETRTRSTRMIALDQIRYRVSLAMPDTVTISNSNHTLEFVNPNLGAGVVSRFVFVPSTRRLFYDDNIADATAAQEVAQGPIDLTFEVDSGSNGMLRLKVKSAADVAFGDVDEQDGETAIFLRNI